MIQLLIIHYSRLIIAYDCAEERYIAFAELVESDSGGLLVTNNLP